MVWEDATEAGFPRNNLAPGNYAGFLAQNRVFEGMAAVTEIGFNLSSDGEPLKVEARGVTDGFFPLLGVAPSSDASFNPRKTSPAPTMWRSSVTGSGNDASDGTRASSVGTSS